MRKTLFASAFRSRFSSLSLGRTVRSSLAGACLLVLAADASAQLSWPPITPVTRPWTRWWWEGSAVNKADLTWNLEQYRKAGLGGVEITPIYGVKGQEAAFIDFLSPRWLDVFKHTLSETKRLGLGVDLANATGWPFGGPWVKEQDASQSVYFKSYPVTGGASIAEPLLYQREAFVRTANNKPLEPAAVRRPIRENKNLQEMALDQVVFAETLRPETVMAYSGSRSLDLTQQVDKEGKLNWTAPAGENWTVYALFSGLHGKMVERAAPGGEGYAIDHFSARAANRYFQHFDQAFKGVSLAHLRGFFNDSYEVDDARGQANWTPGLFEEFRKRRGYDLKQHLPALFGKDSEEKNRRILYDYRSTIDELILHHFTEVWKKWGASKGKLVRNQSHGSPANTLDLYDAVDIPETEGTDILRFKFATSAANVGGKKLASAESATWLNEHFLSSWGDVKKIIDLYFLGGVNHIVYHGTEYSPKDAPWPGWLFYAAVHFQPTNPQWKDFHALNHYVTRVQSFLQSGRPDNEVLLYYPLIDKYSEPTRDLLQHFDGMERNFEHSDFERLSRWMMEEGYGFDFFSDRQLRHFTTNGNSIKTKGNAYRTILLPGNQLITNESLRKLIELAQGGANILVYKSFPSDVPGWSDLDARRSAFRRMKAQLSFRKSGSLQRASIGRGTFWLGEDLDDLLSAAGLRPEKLASGLSFLRRRNAEGAFYFIDNRSDKAVNEWVLLRADAGSVSLFNPMTGQSGLGRWRKAAGGVEVLLSLQPHESIIVQTSQKVYKGPLFPYYKTSGAASTLASGWKLEFLSGGPQIPSSIERAALHSWTEEAGQDLKSFSGTARYTVSFPRPAGTARAWLLDLGRVHETAEVLLNGQSIATLVGPDFRVIIPDSLIRGTNRLDILVSNLMANRIRYMDRNNLPWKIFYNINMPARLKENAKNGFFDASSWSPRPSGLLGPVTLTPLGDE